MHYLEQNQYKSDYDKVNTAIQDYSVIRSKFNETAPTRGGVIIKEGEDWEKVEENGNQCIAKIDAFIEKLSKLSRVFSQRYSDFIADISTSDLSTLTITDNLEQYKAGAQM